MRVRSVTENHHRTWTPNLDESKKQPIVCSHAECGKSFAKPIDLKVLIENEQARYYACPYCFRPVGMEAVVLENINVKRIESRSRIQTIKPDGCEHFIGYLKTRREDSPISDQCLTCDAVLKCMVLKKESKGNNVHARI